MKSFKEYLTEASLGRFYHHMMNKTPILIVSASRSDVPAAENKANNEDLRKKLKLAGFGFNRVKGKYNELVTNKQGIEMSVTAIDDTCIVYAPKEMEQALLNLGMALGKKYNQDSILFFGEKTGYKPTLISTRNDSSIGKIGTRHVLGAFHAQKDSDVMTAIRGKSYHFDWEEETPAEVSPTMNEAIVRKAFREFLCENDSLENWKTN